MVIDGRFSVAAPPERLLANLFNARLMAECMPGCESLEALADDRYRAVVVVSLAGIKARFDLQVEVVERRSDGIRALTRGEEGGNASRLSATSEVRLDPAPEGTQVVYTSEVSVTGRLGRFALGMMKKKAQAMGDEFAANLQRRLPEATAPTDESAAAAAEAAPAREVPMSHHAQPEPAPAEAATAEATVSDAATPKATPTEAVTSEAATNEAATTEDATAEPVTTGAAGPDAPPDERGAATAAGTVVAAQPATAAPVAAPSDESVSARP